MEIRSEADGREFAAQVFMTLANEGPEKANAMILSLGRSHLQIAYSSLLMKYAELHTQYIKLEKSAKELLEALEEALDE